MSLKITNDLLVKIEKAEVFSYPFEHYIIENFLPEEVLNNVHEFFKTWQTLPTKDTPPNGRLSIGLGKKYSDQSFEMEYQQYLSSVIDWKLIVRNLIQKFENGTNPELLRLMEDGTGCVIRSTEEELQNLRKGRRAFNIDVQPGMNPQGFAGLEPHIDAHHKLIASLLYIDLGKGVHRYGGDLLLHSAGPGTRFHKNTINPWYSAEPVKRVEFKDNRLVVILNSNIAIHSVEAFIPPKNTTPPYPRCLINIIAEASSTDYLAYDPRELPQSLREKVFGVLIGSIMLPLVYFRSRVDKRFRKMFRSSVTWSRTVSNWKHLGRQNYTNWRKILKL